MKSSTGQHYLALDHLRALAAFTVFAWHFSHAGNGYPVPFTWTPFAFPPFSILDEGHTGVALFMTLSGYLFAKLLGSKPINYWLFIYNRALRLLPLLILVIAIVALLKIREGSLLPYLKSIIAGALLPTLPNGGWSITVEFHFYLALPILLYLARRSIGYLFVIICTAIAFRFFYYNFNGSVQHLAYWTIVGRIDQFVLGMLSAYIFPSLPKKGPLALIGATCLFAFYTWFDAAGGFYEMPAYPSPSAIWVILPTIEAFSYAVIIGWYDHFQRSPSLISRAVGKIGDYSYSIYLLHFFVVFRFADYIHTQLMDISNFYVALLWSLPAFGLVTLMAAFSYHVIELPFLKHRKNYVRAT